MVLSHALASFSFACTYWADAEPITQFSWNYPTMKFLSCGKIVFFYSGPIRPMRYNRVALSLIKSSILAESKILALGISYAAMIFYQPNLLVLIGIFIFIFLLNILF